MGLKLKYDDKHTALSGNKTYDDKTNVGRFKFKKWRGSAQLSSGRLSSAQLSSALLGLARLGSALLSSTCPSLAHLSQAQGNKKYDASGE